MDFTREPIIETVITPKEGCKLVVRSSKGTGQEEYFVDAVEVVSFGNSFFFRSLERPKSFLVPATDYEILEVREARMVLKNVGLERSIKIGGGREASSKAAKETVHEKIEPQQPSIPDEEFAPAAEAAADSKSESRSDKKRDRRSRYRRRRGGREEGTAKEEPTGAEFSGEGEKIEIPSPENEEEKIQVSAESVVSAPTLLSSILPPPPTLISETIARYKDNAMFKGAFFMREESSEGEDELEGEEKKRQEEISIEEPNLSPFAVSHEEEKERDGQQGTSFSLEEELLHPNVESGSEHSEQENHLRTNNSNSNP